MRLNVLVGLSWPYANGHLHLGHIASSLPADVIARYYRDHGANVSFVSGSDCFGTPILVSAKNENLTPYMFGVHSKEKMWWQCLNCGKEYQSAFAHRARGHGCPNCGRKKISQALKLSVHKINIKTGEIIKTFMLLFLTFD